MLIELPDTLVMDGHSPHDEHELVQVVNELLSKVLKKEHEVKFGFEFLEWIIPKFQMLGQINSMLSMYRRNWHTMPIPQFLTEYVRMVKTYSEEGDEKIGNRVVHKICFTRFKSGEIFSRSRLVCENNNDYRFYTYICDWKKERIGCKNNIAMAPAPGGGVTTEQMLQNCLNQNCFTLCIVDSDKRFPGCKTIGDTAKKCYAVARQKLPPFPKMKVLGCMESENLIPHEILSNLHYDKEIVENRRVEVMSFFQTIPREELDTIAAFYDLKDGFKKNPNFMSKPKWMNFIKKCHDIRSLQADFHQLLANLADNMYIMCGIRGDVLEKSIEWINNHYETFIKTPPSLLPFQEAEWEEIGQYIVDYGFASTSEGVN